MPNIFLFKYSNGTTVFYLQDAPTELKLNIYKADGSYYQNLLGTSFINPTTGEVVLKGDKVPNPSKPEETTPSEETTTETMEVPTTEKIIYQIQVVKR